MKYNVTTPPTTTEIEALVSLDDLKVQLGITHTAFDTRLQAVLVASYFAAEQRTGRALLAQTVCAVAPSFTEATNITHTPLVAITKIEYRADDKLVELLAANYRKAEGGILDAEIIYSETPSTDIAPDAVRITYTAGYTLDKVPGIVREAILMLATDLWNSRGDRPDAKLSLVDNLLRTIRVPAV